MVRHATNNGCNILTRELVNTLSEYVSFIEMTFSQIFRLHLNGNILMNN